jgi:hypothetical protein
MKNVGYTLTISFLLSMVSSASGAEDDFNTLMMRATVKISHDQSTATGFILVRAKPDKTESVVLVTAAHVFEKTIADETKVIFRVKKGEGEYTKEPTPLIIRKKGQPLWTKHPTEDVAVIAIDPPKTADLPPLSTDLLATDEQLRALRVHPGDPLACLGYPHRVEGSKAGFALLRDGPVASFPLVPTAKTKAFFMSANIFEGDSGGPVYLARSSQTKSDKDEVRLIVGLITGQQCLDEEMKMVYGTTTMRHRLGLAIVVHATFIQETVELLK